MKYFLAMLTAGIVILFGSVSADEVATESVAVEEYTPTITPRPTAVPLISPLPDVPGTFDGAVQIFENTASEDLDVAVSVIDGFASNPFWLLVLVIPLFTVCILVFRRLLKAR